MADFIDKEKALTIIDNYGKTVDTDGKVVVNAIRDIISTICPTEKVAPVRRGEWTINEVAGEFQNEAYCSVCGNCIYTYHYDVCSLLEQGYIYCPHCGCKMRQGRNGWLDFG